jgi:hypothetical protein
VRAFLSNESNDSGFSVDLQRCLDDGSWLTRTPVVRVDLKEEDCSIKTLTAVGKPVARCHEGSSETIKMPNLGDDVPDCTRL